MTLFTLIYYYNPKLKKIINEDTNWQQPISVTISVIETYWRVGTNPGGGLSETADWLPVIWPWAAIYL